MGLPCSLRWVLLAAAVHIGLGEDDAVVLLQQSVSAGLHRSFSQGPSYSSGEEVQVKFREEARWVDCTIRGAGRLADTYNIHVPSMMNGTVKDKTFNDVPIAMLRKAYKGFEINIESGDGNERSWVPCLLTAQNGNRFNVELMELRPGLAIENVPADLLREDKERVEKARRIRAAVEENQANKANLFYIAEVKRDPVRDQAFMQRQQQEESAVRLQNMREYVWEEMAKRNAKEEEDIRQARAQKEKEAQDRQAKKEMKKQAKKEARIAAQEFNAETDPMAAMLVKARKIQEESRERTQKVQEKLQLEAQAERELRQEQKDQAERRAKGVEEQMALLREQRKAALKEGSPEAVTPLQRQAREKAKMFEALEMQQQRQRSMIREEFSHAEQEEDEKYKEEESRRQEAVMERKQVNARKQLRNAMDAFDEDESPGKQKSMNNLINAVGSASEAKLEASEVDPARLNIINGATSAAREMLSKGMESDSLQDVQTLLRQLPGKASLIERMWRGLQDTDEKMTMQRFQELEIQPLKARLPEVQKKEVKFTALRAGIEMSKLSIEGLRKAIDGAEKGGLPAKEIEVAKAVLQDKETKPVLASNLEKAKQAGDVGRLQIAIAEAEASGLFSGGALHAARHDLDVLRTKNPEQPAATVQALNSVAP